MAPRSGLVLLPDGSGARDRVKTTLVGSEIALWPSARLADADYVLVDLSAEGGDESSAGLVERPSAARCWRCSTPGAPVVGGGVEADSPSTSNG
jgi:hypothetical protein